jgi:16S rRNA (guanine(966)-N(2))-methyltransferase RsmD
MRIIAGSLKGRRLDAPDWGGLRPTSDKLRETLFNVLASRIDAARVLDAYAGSGAVGLEALSRGAAHVTFVERDPRAVRLIAANLERCGVGAGGDRAVKAGASRGDRYAIIRAGFAGAHKRLPEPGFDIIFLDPPYGKDEMIEALTVAAPLAGEATLVVLEHAKRDGSPDEIAGLTRTRALTSGDSALSFYARLNAAATRASVEPMRSP